MHFLLKMNSDFLVNKMRYIILSFTLLCTSCTADTVITPIFEISYPQSKKDSHGLENKLDIITTKKSSIIEVSSQSGIGSAVIKLVQGHWPETINVQLYLKGLEGFTVSNGHRTIEKHSMPVTVYDKNGHLYENKYLMSERGYYEVSIPHSLFIDGINEIIIHWVDFYR